MMASLLVYMNDIKYTVYMYVEADHKCMNQVSADMIMVAYCPRRATWRSVLHGTPLNLERKRSFNFHWLKLRGLARETNFLSPSPMLVLLPKGDFSSFYYSHASMIQDIFRYLYLSIVHYYTSASSSSAHHHHSHVLNSKHKSSYKIIASIQTFTRRSSIIRNNCHDLA